MRVESFRINPQKHDSSHDQSKWIECLLIRFYVYMLKLYPADFRAAFADEMLGVFTMTVRDAHAAGNLNLLAIAWRELRDLPITLFRTFQQKHIRLSAQTRRIRQIQWFVRIVAGLLSVFLLSTLSAILAPSYNLYTQAVPFVVMLFLATISMLFAQRWGRVGGLLTIASGTAIGCCMTLYLYVMAFAEIGLIATVLVGILWALPFLIFGTLFYHLSSVKLSVAAST